MHEKLSNNKSGIVNYQKFTSYNEAIFIEKKLSLK